MSCASFHPELPIIITGSEDGKLEMYIYSYAYHSLLSGYLSQLSALHFHWKLQKILVFFIRVDYLSYSRVQGHCYCHYHHHDPDVF